MEYDFEQWLKDNFYSWTTARIYTWRIRKEYKRKGYPDLESFVRGEIIGKQEIYVYKKAMSAFKKLAEFLAENVKLLVGADIPRHKKIKILIEVKEDTGII